MTAVGRPMRASVISKIEKGDRRVDVDDLVALAMALGVSPSTLMLPAQNPGGPVLSAGEGRKPVFWQRAWRWMHGSVPLLEGKEDDLGEFAHWLATNRPYLSRSEFQRIYLAFGSPADEDWSWIGPEVERSEEAWSWTGPEVERGDEDDGQD